MVNVGDSLKGEGEQFELHPQSQMGNSSLRALFFFFFLLPCLTFSMFTSPFCCTVVMFRVQGCVFHHVSVVMYCNSSSFVLLLTANTGPPAAATRLRLWRHGPRAKQHRPYAAATFTFTLLRPRAASALKYTPATLASTPTSIPEGSRSLASVPMRRRGRDPGSRLINLHRGTHAAGRLATNTNRPRPPKLPPPTTALHAL